MGLRRRVRRGLQRIKPWIRPGRMAPYLALSTSPPVIHSKNWAFTERPAPIWRLLDALKTQEVHLLYRPSWYVAEPSEMKRVIALRDDLVRRYPRLLFTVMADTEHVAEVCATHGLASLFCNNNAFADERIYRPLPGSSKLFDAVYDAKLSEFKRHELAAQIQSLALISYPHRTGVPREYGRMVRRELSHAHWFNDPLSPQFRRLDPREVNEALSQCRVGLCLSAREGTMRASVQYLLAGLSVVSTESEGGRDEFFDPDYVRIVADEPEAVTQGVRDLIRTPIDPIEIRDRTLSRMWPHRRRLIAFVNEIRRSVGEDRPFEDDWPFVYTNHLEYWDLDGRHARRQIDAYNAAIIQGARTGKSAVIREGKIVPEAKSAAS